MVIDAKITADKAYGQDVKTMSYDELMETIRFLDHEREEIKKTVTHAGQKETTATKDKRKAA